MEGSPKAASVPQRLAVANPTEGGLLQATLPRARSAATGNFATAGRTTIPLWHPTDIGW
jgi:hypothetical protein